MLVFWLDFSCCGILVDHIYWILMNGNFLKRLSVHHQQWSWGCNRFMHTWSDCLWTRIKEWKIFRLTISSITSREPIDSKRVCGFDWSTCATLGQQFVSFFLYWKRLDILALILCNFVQNAISLSDAIQFDAMRWRARSTGASEQTRTDGTCRTNRNTSLMRLTS